MRCAEKPWLTFRSTLSFKVRCSGQPSGCDRCLAVSAECRYPGREVRRKKPPESRQIETLRPISSMSSSKHTSGIREQTQGQGQGQSQGQGLEQSTVGLGSGQSARKRPHTADTSVGIRDLGTRPNQSQQQMKQGLSSYSVGDGSPSGSVLDGLDEWLGMDSFLDPMMMTPLENFDCSVDMLDETMEGSLSGDADCLIGE